MNNNTSADPSAGSSSRRPPQMDEDPDFRAEMRIDSVREYGVGPFYPDYIGDAIQFAKTRDAATLNAKNREVAALLARLAKETEQQNKSVHAHLKPHLKRVYEGKNFPLMRKLLEMSLDRTPSLQPERGNVLSIVTKLIQGFKQTGDLQPSGFWKRLPLAQVLAKKKEALSARPERTRQPPTGPHWASEDLIENMWAQRDKRLAQGIWHEAPQSSVGRIGAAKAFPVVKNEKIRVYATKEMEIRDSIRIHDDLLKKATDVGLYSNPRPLGAGGWGRDPNFEHDDGSEYGFNPQMAKDDMEAFYYQSGVQEPALNAVWFPVPFSVSRPRIDDSPLPPPATEASSSYRDPPPPLPMDLLARSRDDKFPCPPRMPFGTAYSEMRSGLGGAAQAKAKGKGKGPRPRDPVVDGQGRARRWQLVLSDVALFGSLSSVYDCVTVSESLQLIVAKILVLVATIYIDDIHLFSRCMSSKTDRALLQFLFVLLGWKISPEKSEDQFQNAQRLITVLGVSYTWRDLNVTEVTIEDRTAQECLKWGQALLVSKHVEQKELERYRGLYRHCLQLKRTQSFLAKALDQWRADAFFKLVKRVKERASLMGSVRGMQDAARRVAPIAVSRLTSLNPIVHGYTDAAGDDAQEANIAIQWARAAGRPVDLTPFSVRIGGFLNLAPTEERAFSCTLTTVPDWVSDVNIGVLEALAARVFVDHFAKYLSNKLLALHVDNLGDVFSLCRNSSRNVTIQRVCTAYHRVLEENQIGTCVTWISTKRNIADVLTREAPIHDTAQSDYKAWQTKKQKRAGRDEYRLWLRKIARAKDVVEGSLWNEASREVLRMEEQDYFDHWGNLLMDAHHVHAGVCIMKDRPIAMMTNAKGDAGIYVADLGAAKLVQEALAKQNKTVGGEKIKVTHRVERDENRREQLRDAEDWDLGRDIAQLVARMAGRELPPDDGAMAEVEREAHSALVEEDDPVGGDMNDNSWKQNEAATSSGGDGQEVDVEMAEATAGAGDVDILTEAFSLWRGLRAGQQLLGPPGSDEERESCSNSSTSRGESDTTGSTPSPMTDATGGRDGEDRSLPGLSNLFFLGERYVYQGRYANYWTLDALATYLNDVAVAVGDGYGYRDGADLVKILASAMEELELVGRKNESIKDPWKQYVAFTNLPFIVDSPRAGLRLPFGHYLTAAELTALQQANEAARNAGRLLEQEGAGRSGAFALGGSGKVGGSKKQGTKTTRGSKKPVSTRTTPAPLEVLRELDFLPSVKAILEDEHKARSRRRLWNERRRPLLAFEKWERKQQQANGESYRTILLREIEREIRRSLFGLDIGTVAVDIDTGERVDAPSKATWFEHMVPGRAMPLAELKEIGRKGDRLGELCNSYLGTGMQEKGAHGVQWVQEGINQLPRLVEVC
eukprot:g2928.t1